MMLENINILAVLCAAVSAFVLGGLWYSPIMFLNVWSKEAGHNIENIEHNKNQSKNTNKHKHGAWVFFFTFLFSLLAAGIFALLIGPRPAIHVAIVQGLIIGFCFVATSFGINYLFAGRSMKLLLIDAGYHIVQFALYGLILGLWH